MDGSRFDAWTRRRVGLALGGGIASVLGLAQLDLVSAKNKKKKRRRRRRRRQEQQCKALRSLCAPEEHPSCCEGLECGVPYDLSENPTQTYCCYPLDGHPCATDRDCCYPSFCVQETCVVNSNRELKANFGSIDGRDMLRRVRELPIATWSDTRGDPAIRHIGPLAKDFAVLFGVGSDDRTIHPVDGQGVVLSAIQVLRAEVVRLGSENDALADRIAALETARGQQAITDGRGCAAGHTS
jgi:hypothetical protein